MQSAWLGREYYADYADYPAHYARPAPASTSARDLLEFRLALTLPALGTSHQLRQICFLFINLK